MGWEVIKKVDEEPKQQYKTNMLSIYICMLATCNLMFLHPYFNPHSFASVIIAPIAFKCEQKESVSSIGEIIHNPKSSNVNNPPLTS